MKKAATKGRFPQAILGLAASIAFLAAASAGETPSDNGSVIIAKGEEGFVVTQRDVEVLTQFVNEHMSFEIPPEAAREYAVMTYLFAKEARRRDLRAPESFRPLEPVHGEIALAEAYLDRVLRDYALDPIVIESYYKAHFEDYLSKAEDPSTQKVTLEEGLVSLEASKDSIRQTLLGLVRQRIAEQSFQRLVESYRVTGDFSHGN